MSPSQRTPASTYRLQVSLDFDLFEASRRLAYLHDLGVDWVYLSPLLAAEPGSTHGYDVVAPDRVDESRGGAEGLAALSAEAHRLGMGVLVDIVPNHLGVATPAANAWWWDVLEHGRDSVHAEAFDIDWEFGRGRVRLPVLGDDDLPHDGAGIGHLTVQEGELRYHDHRFPIAPGTGEGPPDEVHARQHYELIGWRRGDADLNYRRFFTVTSLAGVRVEVPEVFAATHTEVRRWFDEGLVDGLRIDHPDGLRDPEGYLEHLAGLTSGAYTLVEKILALRDAGSSTQGSAPSSAPSSGTGLVEELPRGWAMDGTTGYDVLGLIDRVLTDPSAADRLGEPAERWHQLVHDRKRAVADGSLLAETRRIVRELPDLLPHHHEVLEDAVAEVLACFPVYRSYLPEGRTCLEESLAHARRERPDLAEPLDDLGPVLADPRTEAGQRFQQTSGMVMAKGVEDSAFYRTTGLTSLTEVGGDPVVFSVSPDDFHAAMATRQAEWPHSMTALSTHDTKRSEDVRARITVLAEVPGLWTYTREQLQQLAPMPGPAFGNLLWQALVGAWPIERERITAYGEKAMREAGDHTTWTDPDTSYEDAVHSALDKAYDDAEVGAVIEALVARIAPAGRCNSLAAKLVAITAPGVPDVYQGTELWDLSLVDPDNRRPVDFESAAASLADGSVDKQQVTSAALRLRRDRPELFTSYSPLIAEGPAADHLLAFDRGGVITVATRLPLGLAQLGGWGDTILTPPPGQWIDTITGREVTDRLADILELHPVALLVRED